MATRGHHALMLNAIASAAFPAYVSCTPSNTNGDMTSHTVNLPARSVGDLLIIQFVNDGAATVTPDAGLTGLQTVFSTARVGNDYRTSVYAWIATSTTGASTATFATSAGEHMACLVHRIAAGTFDPVTLPQYTLDNAGSGANPDPPSLSPSWGATKTLWLACYTGGNASQTNSAYPYSGNQNTQRSNPSAGGTGTVTANSCTAEVEAGSEDPGAFTKSGAGTWSAYTIGVKPA